MADDPLESRSPVLYRFFARVMARTVRRGFYAARLAGAEGLGDLGDRPLVVYANHPSWWDPAFFCVLHERLWPDRAAFGPIDRDALGQYRFMARIGLFGVERGARRGAAAFLRTSLKVLAAPGTVLWLTPEGHFTDVRVRPVRLQPGLTHLVPRCPPATLLVPLAVEYPFWEERYPEALARFGRPIEAAGLQALNRETVAARLAEGLSATMDRLREDAIARDPARFATLFAGRAGVGGVYDLYRGLRARLRGETFHPEHGRR